MASGGTRPGLAGESGRNFPRGRREACRGPGSRVAWGCWRWPGGCARGLRRACPRLACPAVPAGRPRVSGRGLRYGLPRPGGSQHVWGPTIPEAQCLAAVAASSSRQERKFAVAPREGPCGYPCRPVSRRVGPGRGRGCGPQAIAALGRPGQGPGIRGQVLGCASSRPGAVGWKLHGFVGTPAPSGSGGRVGAAASPGPQALHPAARGGAVPPERTPARASSASPCAGPPRVIPSLEVSPLASWTVPGLVCGEDDGVDGLTLAAVGKGECRFLGGPSACRDPRCCPGRM